MPGKDVSDLSYIPSTRAFGPSLSEFLHVGTQRLPLIGFQVKMNSEFKKEENVGYMKQQMKLNLRVCANNCSLWHTLCFYTRGVLGRQIKQRKDKGGCVLEGSPAGEGCPANYFYTL